MILIRPGGRELLPEVQRRTQAEAASAAPRLSRNEISVDTRIHKLRYNCVVPTHSDGSRDSARLPYLYQSALSEQGFGPCTHLVHGTNHEQLASREKMGSGRAGQPIAKSRGRWGTSISDLVLVVEVGFSIRSFLPLST